MAHKWTITQKDCQKVCALGRVTSLSLALSRCARRDEASGGYSVLFLSTHPSIYLTSVWWCVHWHWWPPALPIPQPPDYKMKHHDWIETVKRCTLTHTFTQTQITFNNLCVDRQIVCVSVCVCVCVCGCWQWKNNGAEEVLLQKKTYLHDNCPQQRLQTALIAAVRLHSDYEWMNWDLPGRERERAINNKQQIALPSVQLKKEKKRNERERERKRPMEGNGNGACKRQLILNRI